MTRSLHIIIIGDCGSAVILIITQHFQLLCHGLKRFFHLQTKKQLSHLLSINVKHSAVVFSYHMLYDLTRVKEVNEEYYFKLIKLMCDCTNP